MLRNMILYRSVYVFTYIVIYKKYAANERNKKDFKLSVYEAC